MNGCEEFPPEFPPEKKESAAGSFDYKLWYIHIQYDLITHGEKVCAPGYFWYRLWHTHTQYNPKTRGELLCLNDCEEFPPTKKYMHKALFIIIFDTPIDNTALKYMLTCCVGAVLQGISISKESACSWLFFHYKLLYPHKLFKKIPWILLPVLITLISYCIYQYSHYIHIKFYPHRMTITRVYCTKYSRNHWDQDTAWKMYTDLTSKLRTSYEINRLISLPFLDKCWRSWLLWWKWQPQNGWHPFSLTSTTDRQSRVVNRQPKQRWDYWRDLELVQNVIYSWFFSRYSCDTAIIYYKWCQLSCQIQSFSF